jgi:hypothetical protein
MAGNLNFVMLYIVAMGEFLVSLIMVGLGVVIWGDVGGNEVTWYV